MNWNKFKKSIWFIPVIVAIVTLLCVTVVFAATTFQSKTIPATGTINITTTTTTTPSPDFNYTLSPNISFGTTSFACGSSVVLTGTVTIANTGNQTINSFSVAGTNLPSWITDVSIVNSTPITPLLAGVSESLTIQLTGTAPSSPISINLVGATPITTASITITPS